MEGPLMMGGGVDEGRKRERNVGASMLQYAPQPTTKNKVLKETGVRTIEEYIQKRRDNIMEY